MNLAHAGTVTTAAGRGPSTVDSPYQVAVAPNVRFISILTVGESVNNKPNGDPYRLVGLVDGLGAFNNGDGTFTLLVNHEIGSTLGVPRRHHAVSTNGNLSVNINGKGAFVSRWTINSTTLAVIEGEDLIKAGGLNLWDRVGQKYVVYDGISTLGNIGRLCSADLPPVSAFQFTKPDGSSVGTRARIFMSGEEDSSSGRGFAHIVTGTTGGGVSYELPGFGLRVPWENLVASPFGQEKTIVVGLDDGNIVPTSDSQVYVYVGTKTSSGTDVDRAGLNNGILYGVVANGILSESRETGIGLAKGVAGKFTMAALPDQKLNTAIAERDSDALGITQWLRPEDGAWDPVNPKDFYFATTDRFDTVKTGQGTQIGRTRLWRLRFTDLAAPETGGDVTMLLDGTEAMQMLDNIGIDALGNIVMQEDPGNQEHLARTWNYAIKDGTLTELAKHDPARFGDIGVAPSSSFNTDEEASGVIDMTAILGAGWWLVADQAHRSDTPETVEKGQLQAMFNPLSVPTPTITSSSARFSITPANPVVNTVTTFAITATTTSGGTILWKWDFGDGTTSADPTTTAANASVTKTYISQGTYTVTVVGTDSLTGKTITNSQSVVVRAAVGGGRLQIFMKFNQSNKDKAKMIGTLNVRNDIVLEGKKVDLNVGGILRNFTLNKSGLAEGVTSSGNSFKLYVRKKPAGSTTQNAKFQFNLSGDFRASLADEGIIDADVDRSTKSVRVQITLDGKLYDQTLSVIYSAKLGKGGFTR